MVAEGRGIRIVPWQVTPSGSWRRTGGGSRGGERWGIRDRRAAPVGTPCAGFAYEPWVADMAARPLRARRVAEPTRGGRDPRLFDDEGRLSLELRFDEVVEDEARARR